MVETRLTLSQFGSFEIRHETFINCIKLADARICMLENSEWAVRVVLIFLCSDT